MDAFVKISAAMLAAQLCLTPLPAASASDDTGPLGIGLEGFAYPYPVRFLDLTRDGEGQRLAYMDVPAEGSANGRTALLLHGRNFPASYWQPVIQALARAGYRVVAPDQLGFGKFQTCIKSSSSKQDPILVEPKQSKYIQRKADLSNNALRPIC